MSCLIQKFGGTSVATIDRIRNVANIVSRTIKSGHKVVVVVSAMAGVTNKFVELANDLNAFEGDPEYDSVVSSGELVTSGLTAIALKNLGFEARSYASWQVPIHSSNEYGSAEIRNIDPRNLLQDLESGVVPVVCGFQGISDNHRITTLGRGGSDLTAVAIADAVKADVCEIYSDVDGVYTVDPNLYNDARMIKKLSYREMLEMASQGAKVLQEQSVAYAMEKGVIIRVASCFVDGGGTIVSSAQAERPFCGIAVTHNLSQIVVECNADNSVSVIAEALKKNKIKAEMFCGNREITIMVSNKLTQSTISVVKGLDCVVRVGQKVASQNLSKMSVIGASITEEVGKYIETELKKNKINTFLCSSSEYRLNVIVESRQLLNSIAVLHKYCGLDNEL